jgi:hypothetical protein
MDAKTTHDLVLPATLSLFCATVACARPTEAVLQYLVVIVAPLAGWPETRV